MILGADVSQIQGVLSADDWQRFLAEGRAFAIDKCGGGITGVDARWAANSASCRAAGIPFGAYFAFVPDDDASAQVNAWFAASAGCGRSPGELPPVIDFEEASKTISEPEEISALCLVIPAMTARWGRAPMLYTYLDFWRRIIANATADELAIIGTCPLWFASYGGVVPPAPRPWTAITFWQRSGGQNGFRMPNGVVCDDDIFLGTADELTALASSDAAA